MLKDTDKLDFLTNFAVAVRLKSDDKLVNWYFCDYFLLVSLRVAEKTLNFQDRIDTLSKMRASSVAE